DICRSGRHPDTIAGGAQIALQELDGLDYNHPLGSASCHGPDGLPDKRMHDGLQLSECLGIVEDQPPQLATVDLPVRVQQPAPKSIDHRLVARRTFGDGTMAPGVGVNAISAEVFEHLAHDTLASGDVSGQTDDKFAGPVAHERSVM